MLIAMVATLAVAAIVAFGGTASTQAYAADDDGSATATADIVLVAPGGDGNGSGDGSGAGDGSGNGSATRGATTRTGDPIAWAPVLAVGLLAAGVAVFARRQVLAGAQVGHASTRAANARPSAPGRPAARRRPSAYARPSAHARSGSHAKRSAVNWGRVGVAALAVALVALAASTVMVFSARAANDTIRIEMQQVADGTYSGTTTYYVNNDATYYRDLVKVTETANAGYSISDGSVTITIAPASDPDDAIASPDAEKGAATSGGATWRMPGSAVSDDHALALKVTATAKQLKAGDNTVGTATFDMTAPLYEDLAVRLSTAPVVGRPLAASVSDAPEEATNDFTYTWLYSDDDGATWKEIPGATGKAFTPTANLAGMRIGVNVACANPAWFVVSPTDFGTVAPTCPAPAEGQHLVLFDVGEHGAAPAAQVVDDGANAQRPTDPTATGYTFGGWFADAECTQEFSFTTSITEDTTLYALWIPGSVGTYTVVHLQQSLDDLATYAEVDRDVKTGEFSGELADIARTYAGFTAVRFERDTAATGGHVLNVYYDRKAYTVTFHANGSVYDTATVLYGAQVVKPATDPTATGKDFSCWTKTEGNDTAYDFAAPVTGDLDLYARFAAQVFTVTFETWGQQPKPDDQQVEYGGTPTKPSSPVEGQGSPKFQGWFADASYATPFDFTASVHANATVYAKYSPNVLVDFQGKAPNVSFPKQYGSTFAESELAGVTAPGYDIVDDKWYKDASFSTKWDFPITMDDDKVIYPKLSARTDTPYKVEHYQADLTGGAYTLADTDNLQGTTATDTAAAAKAYAGFTCEGTEQGGNGTITQATIAGNGKTVVKVYYKRNTDTPYTVEHWLQNTAGNDYTHDTGADQTLKGTTGAATAAAAKTYTGFTAQAITQGTIAGDGTTVVKVYYDRATYTVTYDVQGHGDTPDPVGVRHGSTLSNMPAPTATGYTFGGWYKDANCTDAWNAGSDMVTGDITLYAKWEGRPYKIIFNANSAPEGSTQTMADISTKVGQSTTLTENAFTREGWTFAGWDTEADGKGTHYDDKASSSTFSKDGTDVVLYAQWIGNANIEYTVEHYQETGFGTNTYEKVDGDTQTLKGTAGTLTAAAAKTTAAYDDFVCSGTTQGGDGTIEQQAIRGDRKTVVKIYYKKGVCTVTFQAWGQTVADPASPQRVAHGDKATKPTTPAENAGNPKFEGWYTDASFTSAFDFTTAITSDITLYGKFSPRVTVKFMLWDGSTAGSQVGESSVPLVMTGDPASAQLTSGDLTGVVVPAGYTLSGTDYYTDAACGDILSLPKEGITDDSTVVYGRVTANTDTKYKVEHYQQSLSDENSYQLVATDEKEGTTGADTEAAANTPAGFTLEGTTKGDTTGTITQQPIAGDGSTVVAIYYKRNTVGYKVEHYQQDVTGSGYTQVVADDEAKSAKTGATTEAVAKTYTGFEAKAFSQETVAGDGTTVVKIYYDRETFTVTFHEQGHGTAPGTQTVRYGGTATKPADPTEVGYDFGGWFQEEGCTNAFDFTQTVTENKDAYAKWTIQQFLVSFLVEEIMANKPADQTVDYGGKATQPTGTIAKTGYHLIGWFKDAGYTSAFDFATELIKATTSVYGNFAADTYTVAYDANDGSSGSTVSGLPSNQVKTYGVDLTLSSAKPARQSTPSDTTYTVTYDGNGGTPTRESDTVQATTAYAFTGWNTNADGTSGAAYAAGAAYTVNQPTTLYAQWSSQGGATPVTLPSAAGASEAIAFAGWYTAAEGGTFVGAAGGSYETAGNTTLYAHYSKYYLKFENYGSAGAQRYEGSGTMENQVVDIAAGYTVNTCTLSPPDSSVKFVGWNTKEDGTGRWVLDGESVLAKDNSATTELAKNRYMNFTDDGAGGYCCTLYAQWSHLVGMTASSIANDADRAKYSSYVGDVWIPVTTDGDPTSYDKLAVSSAGENLGVLVCTLIGAGHDGEGVLTFATQSLPYNDVTEETAPTSGAWRETDSLSTSDYCTWEASGTRSNINSGRFYNMLPATLKADGIVKGVTKKNSIGDTSYTVNDEKFWLLGVSELGLETVATPRKGSIAADGIKYAGITDTVKQRLYMDNDGRNVRGALRSQGIFNRYSSSSDNAWLFVSNENGLNSYFTRYTWGKLANVCFCL